MVFNKLNNLIKQITGKVKLFVRYSLLLCIMYKMHSNNSNHNSVTGQAITVQVKIRRTKSMDKFINVAPNGMNFGNYN